MIKLDGYPLNYFGLIMQKGHTHPTPAAKNKTVMIPGRPGAYEFGAEIDVLPFSFPLVFVEQDNISLQNKIREFASFLRDSYGKPREIKLTFDYEPDKYYVAKYSGQMSPERLMGLGTFTLPLTAFDPHAKFIIPSDEITMDSDIPIMSDILWGTGLSNREIKSPQTFEVANNGSLVILFACKIVGSGDNVALAANGKTMTLGTFLNKTIEIKDNYTVKVDGITNLTATNGVFLELMPGMNQIAITGPNLNLIISESLIYKYK